MDLTQAITDAEKLVADLQSLTTSTADPIVTITVTLQSGATQVFVPQA